MSSIGTQKAHDTRSNWTPVDASPHNAVISHSRVYGTSMSGESPLFVTGMATTRGL